MRPERPLLPAAGCIDQERFLVLAKAVEMRRIETERPLNELVGENQR